MKKEKKAIIERKERHLRPLHIKKRKEIRLSMKIRRQRIQKENLGVIESWNDRSILPSNRSKQRKKEMPKEKERNRGERRQVEKTRDRKKIKKQTQEKTEIRRRKKKKEDKRERRQENLQSSKKVPVRKEREENRERKKEKTRTEQEKEKKSTCGPPKQRSQKQKRTKKDRERNKERKRKRRIRDPLMEVNIVKVKDLMKTAGREEFRKLSEQKRMKSKKQRKKILSPEKELLNQARRQNPIQKKASSEIKKRTTNQQISPRNIMDRSKRGNKKCGIWKSPGTLRVENKEQRGKNGRRKKEEKKENEEWKV